MRLSEHPLAIEWLGQFDARDIHIARLLLDSLKLVSLTDSEASIARVIDGISLETPGYLAVFPVDEAVIDIDSKPGSSGRLGHGVTNLARLAPERILVCPKLEEMRLKRIRDIVLVDDFIASGQRVREFWNAWATPTIKSWFSYGVCRLWVAGYAIHEVGMETIFDRITYLKPERIRFDIRLTSSAIYWPRPVLDFCERNASRTDLSIYPHGIGHLAAPIVFQHGCPDNCPVILWRGGKSFRALFPGRGIPAALRPCFDGSNNSGRGPQLLWNPERYKLALALIDDMARQKRSVQYIELVTVLGLLQHGYVASNLPNVMTIEVSRIQDLLGKARELGLVDSTKCITLLGRDIVKRSKKAFLAQSASVPGNVNRGLDYIPSQFRKQICGVQRKSSNAPPTVA